MDAQTTLTIEPKSRRGRTRGIPAASVETNYDAGGFGNLMVVLGLDDRGRPHAAQFASTEPALVERAAAAMDMHVLIVKGDELEKLALNLPAGKLFASGKAFVPFVSHDLYKRLEAYLPVSARLSLGTASSGGKSPASHSAMSSPPVGNDYAAVKEGLDVSKLITSAVGKNGERPTATFPEHWDNIAAGMIVLASEEREDGWWTAHVREVFADGTYLLKFEDFPSLPTFTRSREQIALLHPGYDGT